MNSNWSYRQETLNSGQNRRFMCPVWTWELDGRPWKTMRHLFYATSSFVHHCKAICELNLELQFGNAHLGSNWWLLCPVCPWNLTDDLKNKGHLFYVTLSCVHHFVAIDEFKLELQSGNPRFGSKSAIFCPVWPWNLTDDLEKQKGIFYMPLQALCIIS